MKRRLLPCHCGGAGSRADRERSGGCSQRCQVHRRRARRAQRHGPGDARFTPGQIGATSGDEVTWTDDDKSDEPHTATIVEEFPAPTLDAIFGCGAPTSRAARPSRPTRCSALWSTSALQASRPGRFPLLPRRAFNTISAQVTAPAGTTLKYLCAIHPGCRARSRFVRSNVSRNDPRPAGPKGGTGRSDL